MLLRLPYCLLHRKTTLTVCKFKLNVANKYKKDKIMIERNMGLKRKKQKELCLMSI